MKVFTFIFSLTIARQVSAQSEPPQLHDFTGRFELTTSDNFGNFLKAMGVGYFLRFIANSQTPLLDITKDGDMYTMKTTTTFRNSEIRFKLGEEFDESRLDGKVVKSTMVADGNKLIHTQVSGDSPVVVIAREFTPTAISAIGTCDGVVTHRVYKRL